MLQMSRCCHTQPTCATPPPQIVAFIRGWDLSLVVLAAIPALIIAGGVCGVFTAKLQVRQGGRACTVAG